MESWRDTGFVLTARGHGESGAIVSLLTQDHGRHAGYVRAATSSRMRSLLEPGTLVSADWQARLADSLGTYRLELEHNNASRFMDQPLHLAALQSACALCDASLPEREVHPALYHGFEALLEAIESDLWGVSYVLWEVALLRELGFALDFSKCAGGGDPDHLAYMSPKSGRAVSEEAAAPYKEKLLELPDFLKPGGSNVEDEEILRGLALTGYFLENWVFAQHSHGLPEERQRFYHRFEKSLLPS